MTQELRAPYAAAMTLAERAACLPDAASRDRRGLDLARGERRLAAWVEDAGFADRDELATRLATIGLEVRDLRDLLAVPHDSVGLYDAPGPASSDWPLALKSAFDLVPGTGSTVPGTELPGTESTVPGTESTVPGTESTGTESTVPGTNRPPSFLTPVRPLLDRLRLRFADALARLDADSVIDGTAIERSSINRLVDLWTPMLRQTLILEMHIAKLEERLDGESPEGRFASFIERLSLPEATLDWLFDYPVLGRLLVETGERWLGAWLTALSRFVEDRSRIVERFGSGDPGALVGLDPLGDPHRGGQSVLRLSFESGRRLIYKPRSLAVEAVFQQLLRWLNEMGARPEFPHLEIDDRGAYGWVEVVESRPCSTPAEVESFDRRLGGYLALLYFLEATDMHAENLVARGSEPVLVDLETLFHPQPGGGFSVRSVGILPHPVALGDGSTVDISAFGSLGGSSTPSWFGDVVDAGTDEARIGRRARTLDDASNRPGEVASELPLATRRENLRRGFEATYRLLLRERRAWLDPGGWLDRLSGVEVRILARPSLVYGRLLQESYHPTLLGDALERDRHFDRLWTVGLDAWRALIGSEQRQLWDGDVPIFLTRPGSRDVVSPQGDRWPDLLPCSGIERARQRLLGLGEDDLATQLRQIERAFGTG